MNSTETNEHLLEVGHYMIRVLRAMLHKKEAPALPDGICWKEVWQMARKHSLDVMVLSGVEAQLRQAEPELFARWCRSRDNRIAMTLTQMSEEPRILSAFSQAGLRALPVKGSSLRKLYARPDFRQMADIDLVIPSGEMEKARKQMESLGYQTRLDHLEREHQVSYFLPPFVSVELHDVPEKEAEQRVGYYQGIWEKAVEDPELPGVYHLKPEDAYIYLLLHFIKHMRYAGMGIRQVMDLYLFLQAYRDRMNDEYIRQEAQRLDIQPMREKIEQLTELCFSEECTEADPEVKKMEELCILAGTYGDKLTLNLIMMQRMQQEKQGRFWRGKYLLKRLFPTKEILYSRCPQARGKPWLLPFVWLWRLVDVGYWKNRFARELDYMKQTK